MKISALAILALSASISQAIVLNISTQLGENPVEVTDGGITHVGQSVFLTAGTYTITPVDESFSGANYTAANRFGTVNLPNRGWEWSIYVSFDGGVSGTKYGYGEGAPSTDGPYQATAADAFAAAPSPFNINVAADQDVVFYWLDNVFSDNEGGISINVVPEPATLTILGLGALAALRKRKK